MLKPNQTFLSLNSYLDKLANFNVSIKGLQHSEAKQRHTVSSATLIVVSLRKQKETICNQKVQENRH